MSKKTTPRGNTPGVHFRLPEQTRSQLEDIQHWLARERAVPEVNRTEALLYAVGEAWKRLAKKKLSRWHEPGMAERRDDDGTV